MGDGCKEQRDNFKKKVACNCSQASRSGITRSHMGGGISVMWSKFFPDFMPEHDSDKFGLI